jgi:hypothetical protein
MAGKTENLVSLTSERAREIGKLGGRPRKPRASEVELQTLKERLGPHIDATVERLVELSRSGDPSVSLRACNSIMDRYFGKAFEGSAPERAEPTTDEELRREVDRKSREELIDFLAGR